MYFCCCLYFSIHFLFYDCKFQCKVWYGLYITYKFNMTEFPVWAELYYFFQRKLEFVFHWCESKLRVFIVCVKSLYFILCICIYICMYCVTNIWSFLLPTVLNFDFTVAGWQQKWKTTLNLNIVQAPASTPTHS